MARIRPIPMGRFRARVLDLYRDLGRRPLTLCKLRQVLAELAALEDANGHLTIVKSTDLTTGNLAHWDAQNRTRRAPATRAGLMSYARAACSYAIEEGWRARAPNWRRLWPRDTRARDAPRHLPWLDVGRILTALRNRAQLEDWPARRLYALVATIAYTGLRRDEALCLRMTDVDLINRVIRLVSHPLRPLKTSASRRLIPIPPELREILEAWLPQCQSVWLFPGIRRETPRRGGRLGHRPIDALRAAAQAAGVACPGWHALRHSWITHARTRWGIPDAIVTLIAGHTSIAMTDIYTHPDAANLAAATERITYR